MMSFSRQMFYFIAIIASISVMFSCQNNNKINDSIEKEVIDSLTKNTKDTSVEVKKNNINYVAWDIKNNDSLRKILNKNYTGDSIEILRQINRTDKKYWVNKDTFLIPQHFTLDMMDYSLFPKTVQSISQVKKLVIFSYEYQIYGVYTNGVLEKWGATNMGKQATPTPTGLFFTNWKGKRVVSTVNSSWILQYNFNISNTGGVGWHQYAMPGYPASHSCLRLFLEDAIWLYSYADQWTIKNGQKIANGTPVIVFGEYPWGQSKPWYRLLDGQESITYSEEQITEIIQEHLDKIIESEKQKLSISTTDSI